MSNNSLVSYETTEIPPFYIGSAFASIADDGITFASAINEDIIISDLQQGQVLQEVPGDGEDVTCLQITPDGTKLAILSASHQAQIYNISEEKIISSFKLPSPVYATSVDKTSTLFAFGGTDGLIQVWDIDNGYITHSLKGHSSIISCLKFYGELNSDKWLLLSGDISGTIKVWDLVKRKCIATLNEHNSPVRGLEISDDFKFLVSGGRDQILNLFEISVRGNQKNLNFKVIKSIPTNQQIEACGFLSQIGKQNEQQKEETEEQESYVYFGGDGNYLQVYDFVNSVLVGKTKEPIETTEELMITQLVKISNSRIAQVLSDQTLQIIDLKEAEIDLESSIYNIPISKSFAGNHGIVADLSFVGEGLNKVALATNSPSLRIITPFENRFEVEILQGHTDILNQLSVSEDGKWIVTASKDNDARLWKYNEATSKFDNIIVFRGHSSSVTAVAMSEITYGGQDQPTFVITGSTDLTIKRWEIPKLNKNQLLDELIATPLVISSSKYTRKAHEKDINAIDLSPNNEFFATASYDKTAKIWDSQSGEIVGILRGHKRGLWKIKFCPFDKLVLTCSGDKTLKLWSLQTYQCLKTFEGHTNSVLDCKFINRKKILTNDVSNSGSSSGSGGNFEVNFKKSFNEIVSCGADGLIKIWDMKTGEIIKTFDNHDDKIWCLASKNNGEWLISADNEGTINLWKDNTLEILKENQKEEKLVIEQQQSLENYIRLKDWKNAFKLALKLNHPMKLYNVIKSSVEASIVAGGDVAATQSVDGKTYLGSADLDECIRDLTDDEIKIIFDKLKSWNTNFRFFEISQRLIKCILNSHDINKLVEIPGLMRTIDAIIPYNYRHYQRIDGLLEDSYILDYTIQEMNKLIS